MTTGAVHTDGGLGVVKNVFIGQDVDVAGTTESTSSSTGSIVTDGGVGVAKNLNVGGDVQSANIFVNKNADGNIAIGSIAESFTDDSGLRNIVIGNSAGDDITTGDDNIGIGNATLGLNVSGNDNVAIGSDAGCNVTGSGNTLLGKTSGREITSGSDNVGVGINSMGGTSTVAMTGADNVSCGVNSLRYVRGGSRNGGS